MATTCRRLMISGLFDIHIGRSTRSPRASATMRARRSGLVSASDRAAAEAPGEAVAVGEQAEHALLKHLGPEVQAGERRAVQLGDHRVGDVADAGLQGRGPVVPAEAVAALDQEGDHVAGDRPHTTSSAAKATGSPGRCDSTTATTRGVEGDVVEADAVAHAGDGHGPADRRRGGGSTMSCRPVRSGIAVLTSSTIARRARAPRRRRRPRTRGRRCRRGGSASPRRPRGRCRRRTRTSGRGRSATGGRRCSPSCRPGSAGATRSWPCRGRGGR
jgi:hypothetical protein